MAAGLRIAGEIKCLFLSEFHPIAGPRIAYQVTTYLHQHCLRVRFGSRPTFGRAASRFITPEVFIELLGPAHVYEPN